MPARITGGPRGHARFAGIVRSLQVHGAMALVEIEVGPFLFRTAVSREEDEDDQEEGIGDGVTPERHRGAPRQAGASQYDRLNRPVRAGVLRSAAQEAQ